MLQNREEVGVGDHKEMLISETTNVTSTPGVFNYTTEDNFIIDTNTTSSPTDDIKTSTVTVDTISKFLYSYANIYS